MTDYNDCLQMFLTLKYNLDNNKIYEYFSLLEKTAKCDKYYNLDSLRNNSNTFIKIKFIKYTMPLAFYLHPNLYTAKIIASDFVKKYGKKHRKEIINAIKNNSI